MEENFGLEKIFTEVVDKFIVQPIKHQCDYLCFFARNIDQLTEEHQNLRDAIDGVMPRITAAQNNAEEILPAVSTWLDRANHKLTCKEEIMSQVNTNSCCLCVKSRYSLSRRAVKTVEDMKKHREECPKPEQPITVPPRALAAAPDRLARSIVEFDSRKGIEKDVMDLLRDEDVKVIGIHGMGGVGKTTLVKKIKNRVLSDGECRFDESLMVVVSQDADMLRIQGEIAEKLSLKLDESSLSSRAERLCERLMGGKRILIILDDVWTFLDLDELGIPCVSGLGRCKILLTSRNRDVLDRMGAHKPILEMKILQEEEAWSFFKEKLGGISAHDPTWLSSEAREVAKECKRLPLALEVVAGAMRAKGDHEPSWSAALSQLRSANPEDVGDVIKDVYAPLKLSYDTLTRNAQFIFLLCCLFAEDSNISLERLTFYAMGLGMWSGEFEGIDDHLGQVRDRTYSLIETIKIRSLLLESHRGEDHVRMHDVVRDVAIYIAASTEKQLIKCGQDCEWISPFCGDRNIDLSGGSTLSRLRLLIIEVSDHKGLQINDDSFKGMNELKVLSINFDWTPKSFPGFTQLPKDLRTLIIESCGLGSIDIVGKLEHLEILICRYCDGIEDLCWDTNYGPKSLRLLEVSRCEGLRKIERGVIASVNKLEELMIIRNDKLEWEEEGLREVERLQNLRRLEIEIMNYEAAALQITLPRTPNIRKFHIVFADPEDIWLFDNNSHDRDIVKVMSLNFPKEISLGAWIQETLMNNVEYLCIKKHIPNDLDLSRALNVKLLEIESCSTGRDHLWSSNMVSRYIHLSTIKLYKCNSLHCLLPISRGSDCFPQLKELDIWDCEMLRYVFSWIEEKNENIITEQEIHGSIHQFPLLTKINIRMCPQLRSFISNFQDGDVDEEDDHSSHFFCKIRIESFSKLEILKIHSLEKVKSLFSIDQAQNLVNLKELSIVGCDEMVQVFGSDDDENIIGQATIVFLNLKKLELLDLPRLTSLHDGIKNMEFPVLQEIVILWCPELKRLVPVSEGLMLGGDHHHQYSSHLFCHHQIRIESFSKLEILKIHSLEKVKSLFSIDQAQNLVNLKELSIVGCDEMVQVFGSDDDENIIGQATIVFLNLKKLELQKLPRLTSLHDGIKNIEFPVLQEIVILLCPELKRLVPVYEGLMLGGDHHQYSSHLFCHHQIRIESFSKLEELEIHYLKKVKSLFSIDQAQNLVNLKKLSIVVCHEMVQVFGSDDDENIIGQATIVFLNLKKLELQDLPRLTSLHDGIKNIEFPVLQEIFILSCPELKRLVPVYEGLMLGGDHHHQYSSHLFCHHQVLFTTNCRSLEVEGNESIFNLLCSQIDLHLFTKLEVLSISRFNEMKSLFSISIARDLVNLHTLIISWCEEMIQVIGGDENEKDNSIGQDASNYNITAFPKLKRFELSDLPKLTSVYKGIENIEFPMLQDLSISLCPQLNMRAVSSIEDIKMDHHHSSHLFTHHPPQISFSNSKKLRLEKVENIEISIDFFTGLEELHIGWCNGMSSLFSCSTAAMLINLRKLRIEYCRKMVQVIEEEKECSSHDNQTTLLHHHLFPSLEELQLMFLPGLKIFSGCRCGLTMASLKDVNIRDCPKMERFSLGSLTPSNLERMGTDGMSFTTNYVRRRIDQVPVKYDEIVEEQSTSCEEETDEEETDEEETDEEETDEDMI